eukprot:scaffold68327_cov39-Tisochrysis_lutea.AAC.2
MLISLLVCAGFVRRGGPDRWFLGRRVYAQRPHLHRFRYVRAGTLSQPLGALLQGGGGNHFLHRFNRQAPYVRCQRRARVAARTRRCPWPPPQS